MGKVTRDLGSFDTGYSVAVQNDGKILVAGFFVNGPNANTDYDIALARYEFAPDTIAPDTTISSGPSDPTSNTSATFTFSSNESGGTFTYTLDGGTPVTISTGSASFTGLTLGSHTFTVFATDAAGNPDPTPDTQTWTVTPADPITTLLFAKGDDVPNAGTGGTGTEPPIQTGAKWFGFGFPAINNAGDVAMLGKWKAPAIKTPERLRSQSGVGIFLNGALVIKVGQPVPGAGSGNLPADAKFKSLKNSVLDQAGHVAFIAGIKGKGVTSANDTVVVSSSRTGSLEVVAREGDAAPARMESSSASRMSRSMAAPRAARSSPAHC